MDDGLRAIADTYKPLPGATEEEVAVARRTLVYGMEYLQKHPEIKDPAIRLKVFSDIHNNKVSAYINDAVTTLMTPQKIGDTFLKWAGKDPKKLNMADLYQKGTLQASLDVDSGVKNDFTNMVNVLTPSDLVISAPTKIKTETNKRAEGQFKGLYPLDMRLSSDGKTVYQLWKNGADISWYSLSVSKANNFTDKDWTKVK
jgi:hypothetical protein